MDSVEIYGFSGKLGSGKNYIAGIFANLLPEKPTLVMAFADQLKIFCMIKDGISFERLFQKKDQESRNLLQIRGTEEGRQGDDNIWIAYLDAWVRIHTARGVARIIITDVRFPNEAEWIKSLGGILLRVEAPARNRDQRLAEGAGAKANINTIPEHSSETSLDDYNKFDYIVENDYQHQSDLESGLNDIIRSLLTSN